MSVKYLITLEPIGSFFFGGEQSFKTGEDVEHYIVKSECFPQQTSILGMLRKEMLVIKKLINEKWNYSNDEKKVIDKLIGQDSFNIESKGKQNFGVIKKVSPVFIKKGKNYWITSPKDHNVEFTQSYEPLKFEKKRKFKVSFGSKEKVKEIIPIEYNSKKGILDGFMNDEFNVSSKKDFLTEEMHVGIRTNKSGEKSEKGFYKIIRYRLKNNHLFAFNLELEFNDILKGNELENYTNIVSLGGEGSYFKITFKKVKNNIIDKFLESKELNTIDSTYKKITLVSNMYITKEDYEEFFEYGITNGVVFRNLKTNYEKFNKNKGAKYCNNFKKSNKYIFLEKGSVLYAEKNKNVDLQKNENIINIGYNYYI